MTSTDDLELTAQPAASEQEGPGDAQASPPEPDLPADSSLDPTSNADPPQPLLSRDSSSPPNMTSLDDSHTERAPDAVPPQAENQQPENLALTSLKAVFPDFDDAVLLSILESVGGDQERAIDIILGMSDPDYVSQPVEPVAHVPSQTELDEQFARQLLLEDEIAHQVSLSRHPQAVPQESVPYEARVHGQRLQRQPPVSSERDTLTEFQESFNKFAETGRRTIGNLVAKVKAKVSEFEQQRTAGQAWNNSGASASAAIDHDDQAYPSYYDPNLPAQERPIQGYDIDQSQHPHVPISEPQQNADTAHTAQSTQIDQPSSVDTVPTSQAGSAASASNIDPSKLGLLPKRPVSLLQPVAPPARNDDELEYMENPFEEGER